MKKTLAVLLALTLLMTAVSCSDKNSSSDSQAENSPQTVSSSQAESRWRR